MSAPVIIPLADAKDGKLAGGKAQALARLITAGFAVPDGFVVSADADVSTNKVAVLEAFDALKSPLVAVRSSGRQEDGKTMSWAGQLETFLNVDREHLQEKIMECRASGNSSRALAYAEQGDSGGVAVLVQQMIQSEVSGVAFSLHPVTKNDNQVVIEAVFGLGEALVSGEITPDNYVLQKSSGELLEKSITIQSKQLVLGTDWENTWQPLNSEGKNQKLSAAQLQELTQLVVKLENYFGFPVDVEWAYANQRFYVLQCRPITSLA